MVKYHVCQLIMLINDTNVASVEQLLNVMKSDIEQAKLNVSLAQQRQQRYANEHRRDYEFKVGDKVFLSTSNLKKSIKAQTNKLNSKFIGPYENIGTCW